MGLRAVGLAWSLAVASVAGCGPLPPRASDSTSKLDTDEATPAVRLIATERDDRGGHLVILDERGLRLADLTKITLVPVRDNSPRIAPDGKWVVFASSRARSDLSHTSLWVVRSEVGHEPIRLTHGDFNDRDPVIAADGTLYFSSDRDGSFDLYRAPISFADDERPRLGAVEKLTSLDGDALSPTVAPDGTVVFMRIAANRSTLWRRRPGGEMAQLSEGPGDVTPAFSPDGRYLAFAGKARDRDDADLYLILPDGSNRAVLLDEPLGDQTGPVFSADGRYVFCTSVFRSAESRSPILGSVTVIDLREQTLVLRALHDPAGALSRMSPAVGAITLDARALHENPTYAEALREVARGLLEE